MEVDRDLVTEEIWRKFSQASPEVLDVVEYHFSIKHGEPIPSIPRSWTIRLVIFMAIGGYCEVERALELIWELASTWNPS